MRRRMLGSWSGSRSGLLRGVSRRLGSRLRIPSRLSLPWMSHSQQRISSDQRRGQAENAARKSDAAHSRAQRLQAEDANDTLGERSAVRGHGERRRAAPFFHERKRAGIFNGIAAESHCPVIATVLAFRANLFIQPPDRGMVKQQGLYANLEYIYEGIEPLDMSQFV